MQAYFAIRITLSTAASVHYFDVPYNGSLWYGIATDTVTTKFQSLMMTARNMKRFIHSFKKYYYDNVNQACLERPLAESLGMTTSKAHNPQSFHP